LTTNNAQSITVSDKGSLTLENLPPPTFEKKLLSYGIAKENLNKIYLLPFTATKEVKLAMFQSKTTHSILATNSILYKMKKVASPSCPCLTKLKQKNILL